MDKEVGHLVVGDHEHKAGLWPSPPMHRGLVVAHSSCDDPVEVEVTTQGFGMMRVE